MGIPINCCCLINPNLWDPPDGALMNTKGIHSCPRSRLWVDAVRGKKLLTNVQEIKNKLSVFQPSVVLHIQFHTICYLNWLSCDSLVVQNASLLTDQTNYTGRKTIKLDEGVGYALQTKEINLGVNQAFTPKNTFMPDRSRPTLQQFHGTALTTSKFPEG